MKMAEKCDRYDRIENGAARTSIWETRRKPSRHLEKCWVSIVVSGFLILWNAERLDATIVTPDDFSFHATMAESETGLAAFDGTRFVTPGQGVSFDTLTVSLSGGSAINYSDISFSIDSGFEEISTTVVDANSSGNIDAGDGILTLIGPGSFSFFGPGNVLIIGGAFTSATFSAQYGGNAAGTIASEFGGLILTAGPGFVFDEDTFVLLILNSSSFSLNLSDIDAPGIVTAQPGNQLAPTVFSADLEPFALAGGIVDTSGTLRAVPEPHRSVLFFFAVVALYSVATDCRFFGRVAA